MDPILTEKEYVEDGGIHCIYCKSSDIEGSSFNYECGYLSSEVNCCDCGEQWREHYILDGYTEIEQ